jgi:hypothetical protein
MIAEEKKAFMVCGTKTLFIPCASFILFVESDSSPIKWTFMYKKLHRWEPINLCWILIIVLFIFEWVPIQVIVDNFLSFDILWMVNITAKVVAGN